MSNKTPNNGKNPVATNAPVQKNPVGRPPVVLNAQVWTLVTAALKEQNKLSALAEIANVSVPTMRRLLTTQFGTRVQFARGRKGGVSLVAAKGATKQRPATK
jgi:hypothetical protein